jgi:hypothetical protein
MRAASVELESRTGKVFVQTGFDKHGRPVRLVFFSIRDLKCVLGVQVIVMDSSRENTKNHDVLRVESLVLIAGCRATSRI